MEWSLTQSYSWVPLTFYWNQYISCFGCPLHAGAKYLEQSIYNIGQYLDIFLSSIAQFLTANDFLILLFNGLENWLENAPLIRYWDFNNIHLFPNSRDNDGNKVLCTRYQNLVCLTCIRWVKKTLESSKLLLPLTLDLQMVFYFLIPITVIFILSMYFVLL